MKIIIDFLALIILYIFVFYRRWLSKGKFIFVINTLIYVYIAFVLYFTLMPILTSLPTMFNHQYTFMNLEPFSDVIHGRGDFMRQIVLNIIMMIPFGILIPFTMNNKHKFFKTIALTFIFSLIIEILQPLINGNRSSDITDLITNVIGGIIGYLFYLICKQKVFELFNPTKNR